LPMPFAKARQILVITLKNEFFCLRFATREY